MMQAFFSGTRAFCLGMFPTGRGGPDTRGSPFNRAAPGGLFAAYSGVADPGQESGQPE